VARNSSKIRLTLGGVFLKAGKPNKTWWDFLCMYPYPGRVKIPPGFVGCNPGVFTLLCISVNVVKIQYLHLRCLKSVGQNE